MNIDTTPVRNSRIYMATPHRPSVRAPSTPHHQSRGQQQPASGKGDEPSEKKVDVIEDNLDEVQKHSIHTLVFRSLKRSQEMFASDMHQLPSIDEKLNTFRNAVKAKDQYGPVMHLMKDAAAKMFKNQKKTGKSTSKALVLAGGRQQSAVAPIDELKAKLPTPVNSALVVAGDNANANSAESIAAKNGQIVLASGLSIAPRKPVSMPKPEWHAPWKLFRVISGHTGWVRSIAVEPGNEWFATGSNDRIIKIWDLASGRLKLSLTGHISPVRGLAVSPRQPYLFSCGEDKTVKCWDLEYNKVVRHYHGHLSAVYALALHPTLDILVTGGRDSVARVWDMRTKAQIHALGGHSNTVASIFCEAVDPQVVTGSHDSTVRLWDIVAGKTISTLTNHKKSVRAMVSHPKLSMFCSGSINSLKQWRLPEGNFIQNLNGHDAIVNALAVNEDNVLVSGGDNGSMLFWDWRTGYNFQRLHSAAQPGSIDSECGVFALCFDQSGSRLIAGEADKTIKIYKEDDTASEESHPVQWEPDLLKRKRF